MGVPQFPSPWSKLLTHSDILYLIAMSIQMTGVIVQNLPCTKMSVANLVTIY